MFTLDVPDLSAQSPSIVLVAQADQAKRSDKKVERVMGVCYVVANIPEAFEQYKAGIFPSQTLVYPWEEISAYFTQFEHRNINIEYGSAGCIDKSSATIIHPTAHGSLVDAGPGQYPAYYYKPNDGYFGKDFAIIEGEVNGLKVKLQYYFHVLDTKMYLESEVCGKKGWIWKISSNAGNSLPNLATVAQYGLPGSALATVTYADLPNGALGQTTGQSITLDDNAAGHGWYIDYTPYLNEEYLPTADPNVWQAKEGSLIGWANGFLLAHADK